MLPPHPGHAYLFLAWYGWIGVTTSGPNGESSTSTAHECPDHDEHDDDEEDGHDYDIGDRLVLLAEWIEAHDSEASGRRGLQTVLSP
jgi:hypothetical protein